MITEATEGATHAVVELPIPPEAYGLIAFAALMALLFVTFAFRSVGTRH